MWAVYRPEAIRINALNAAVEYASQGSGMTPEQVVANAAFFEDYIYNGRTVRNG